MKRLLSLLLALAMALSLVACSQAPATETTIPSVGETLSTIPTGDPESILDPDGTYDTKEDVALYIHLYGKLPSNFMTKREARSHGWRGSGSLSKVLPGKCIGGDVFHNREGRLPAKPGRTWQECDIGTLTSGSRGAKRIVFSNDGLVYYTADHYDTFELLYGNPDSLYNGKTSLLFLQARFLFVQLFLHKGQGHRVHQHRPYIEHMTVQHTGAH